MGYYAGIDVSLEESSVNALMGTVYFFVVLWSGSAYLAPAAWTKRLRWKSGATA